MPRVHWGHTPASASWWAHTAPATIIERGWRYPHRNAGAEARKISTLHIRREQSESSHCRSKQHLYRSLWNNMTFQITTTFLHLSEEPTECKGTLIWSREHQRCVTIQIKGQDKKGVEKVRLLHPALENPRKGWGF